MKTCSLIFILLSSFSSLGYSQYQTYLRGSDIPRSIAKKMGYSPGVPMSIDCQSYVNSVDQKNIARGGPSVGTGRLQTAKPDASVLQQMANDIDSCVSGLPFAQASALAVRLFGKVGVETLCSEADSTLCPPGTDLVKGRLLIAVQVLDKPGYYINLQQIHYADQVELQKRLINNFVSHFLGPDEFLLGFYNRQQIDGFKEDLRVILVNKIQNDTSLGQNSSATLLGYMMKTLMLREEFLKINH